MSGMKSVRCAFVLLIFLFLKKKVITCIIRLKAKKKKCFLPMWKFFSMCPLYGYRRFYRFCFQKELNRTKKKQLLLNANIQYLQQEIQYPIDCLWEGEAEGYYCLLDVFLCSSLIACHTPLMKVDYQATQNCCSVKQEVLWCV